MSLQVIPKLLQRRVRHTPWELLFAESNKWPSWMWSSWKLKAAKNPINHCPCLCSHENECTAEHRKEDTWSLKNTLRLLTLVKSPIKTKQRIIFALMLKLCKCTATGIEKYRQGLYQDTAFVWPILYVQNFKSTGNITTMWPAYLWNCVSFYSRLSINPSITSFIQRLSSRIYLD